MTIFENKMNINFQGRPICGFCKKNREAPELYTSHATRNDQGQVTCPILRRLRCRSCGATGADAHTISNCPNVVAIRNQQLAAREAFSNNPANRTTSSQQVATTGQQQQQPQQQPSNVLELGIHRSFANMSSVTSTRYNAAGRLRNRPANRRRHPADNSFNNGSRFS